MEYELVDVGQSTLKDKLIEYAENCSFQGTGAYLAELLSQDAFEDNEKVFAAVNNGEIIGFAAMINECLCVDNENHSPWLDFLFVDERYRNHHIGIALIEKIGCYAKDIGYNSLYLCTLTHVDYYSKSGFEVLYSTDYYNNAHNKECISIMKKDI